MREDLIQSPLVKLYGENAIDLALEEVGELRDNSNIPFDKKYVELGISFLIIKANEIVEGKRKERGLKSLVQESFGEATIYKYNCCGGELD